MRLGGGERLRLKELRLKAGLTQDEVAKKMNVDQSAVHLWETGKIRIARKHHKRLAKLYKCTVDELFAGGEEHAEGGGKADAGLHVGGENSGRD